MNELLKIILSLSLSGTLLILVLFLCKPFFKDRLSKQWQYYIWLVVIARLLLPFAPETNLVGTLFQEVGVAVEQQPAAPRRPPQGLLPNDVMGIPMRDPDNNAPPAVEKAVSNAEGQTEAVQPAPDVFDTAVGNIGSLWLLVAAGLLIRKITAYQSFVKYIKAGRSELPELELWERLGKLVEQEGIKTAVTCYTNSAISSPLLIGFFHPCIMLPSARMPEVDFRYTVLHELTHYKRKDMFYKWLVQVAVCLHWFNPFVHWMGREVNRACELSCDETIIQKLDAKGRRGYGDTLLNAMGSGGLYQDSIASVTLNEGKELLKERLDAIMQFKKNTRRTAALSFAFAFALCFGAAVAGAYTSAPPAGGREQRTSSKQVADLYSDGSGVYYLFYGGAAQPDRPLASVTPGMVSVMLVEKDGYTTLGAFEKSNRLAADIIEQCGYMLQKNGITQEKADWIIQRAGQIAEMEGFWEASEQPQNNLEPPASVDSSGTITLPVSIGSLSAGTEVCIGEIPDIAYAAVIQYDVSTDSSEGRISVGLRKPGIDGTWFCHVEKELREQDKRVRFYFDKKDNPQLDFKENGTGNYQVYIQSKEGDLTNLAGSITIQYETEGGSLSASANGDTKSRPVQPAPPVPPAPPSPPTWAQSGGLALVEKEYTQAELKKQDVSGIVVEVSSENVSIARGGDTLKFSYYASDPNVYTLQREPDGGMTRWNLCLAQTSPWDAGISEHPVSVTVPNGFDLKAIKAVTGSGDIQFENCEASSFMVAETQSGQISINGGSAANFFKVETETGNAVITGISFPEKASASFYTDKGTITFEPLGSVQDYCFVVDTGNEARITVNGKPYPGGDYSINASAANQIYFDSPSGTFVVLAQNEGEAYSKALQTSGTNSARVNFGYQLNSVIPSPQQAKVTQLSAGLPDGLPGTDGNPALRLVEKEYTAGDLQKAGITGIYVEVPSDNIIVSQEGSSLRLQYYQHYDGEYMVSVRDYQLYEDGCGPESQAGLPGTIGQLRLSRTGMADDGIRRTVYITLPADSQFSRVVKAASGTGDITLVNCASTAFINAMTESGDICLESCSSPELVAETDSGRITVNACMTDDLRLNSVRGTAAVRLPDKIGDYQLKADTETEARILVNGKAYRGGDFIWNKNALKKMTFDSRDGALEVIDTAYR